MMLNLPQISTLPFKVTECRSEIEQGASSDGSAMPVMSMMNAVMNWVMHVTVMLVAVTFLMTGEHRVCDGLYAAVGVKVSVVQVEAEVGETCQGAYGA